VQILDKREAAPATQGQINYYYIRFRRLDGRHNARSVPSLSTNHQIRLSLDQLGNPMADDRVIVHEKHTTFCSV
jgi:hypothetical protein